MLQGILSTVKDLRKENLVNWLERTNENLLGAEEVPGKVKDWFKEISFSFLF